MPPGRGSNRIAVTGASGFIGRTLIEALIRSGERVRALVRRPEPSLAAIGVDTIAGALEDAESLRRLVDGTDTVIHCAGLIKARKPENFFTVNVDGTARLVETAVRASPPPRILLVSSLAAREPALSPYAASKRGAEEALIRSQNGVEHCIIRPPAVYGPGDPTTLALFRQLARSFVLTPAGSHARFSLLYVKDLIAAIALLLQQSDWEGSILELDDGRAGGYSWGNLTEIAGRHLGRRVRRLAVPYRAAWLSTRANEALCAAFGWTPMLTAAKLRELYHPDWVCRCAASPLLDSWYPRTTFEEGFPETLQWYMQRGWL